MYKQPDENTKQAQNYLQKDQISESKIKKAFLCSRIDHKEKLYGALLNQPNARILPHLIY